MRPIRNFTAICLVAVSIGAKAQMMTYNHDASKCAQIQVMELGAGTLTPDWYYWLLHNRYKDEAKQATSVKNTLRIAANTGSIPQVEYADSIKSDLEDRAKIEALNIADRELDVAWLAEGGRIEEKLVAFKSNINALFGRTQSTEIEAWRELSKMYDFAIKTTKQAYMPNSERQQQYLAINQEISKSNDNLLLRIRFLATKAQADQIANAMQRFHHKVKETATASYLNWREKSRYPKGTKEVKKD